MKITGIRNIMTMVGENQTASGNTADVAKATVPVKHFVLYDGQCSFCQRQTKLLLALARRGALETVDFQDPAQLARFPGISYEACMQAMHLVAPDGRVYKGFEAAVRAVATRPVLGLVAYLYYLPGIRQACDLCYRWIAARRYRIMGQAIAAGGCDGGTCSRHVRPGD